MAIDAGFTCPNRDGTVGVGGCTYCVNSAFNPSYCLASKSIAQQLQEESNFIKIGIDEQKTILPIFKPIQILTRVGRFEKDLPTGNRNSYIKGLVIGTRPDCIDNEKLDYFAELQQKMFISIEYGVESCRNETLQRINRGHTFEQAIRAIEETTKRGIHVGAHFIFGLPKEKPADWVEDVHKINSLPLHSLKFHQLQIIKNTAMEKEFSQNPTDFHIFSLESYIDFITDYLELLNPKFVIERMAGEVPPRFLAVNQWGTIRYDTILQKIEKMLEKKMTHQGAKFTPPI